MFFQRSYLYSIALGLVYGWVVVSSPQFNSLSMSTVAFDTLLTSAIFAFLLWIPSLFSEAALLLSALGAIIGSAATGGIDGASVVIIVAIIPSIIIGYMFGGHTPLFDAIKPDYSSGIIVLALPLLYFCAFFDSFLFLFLISDHSMPVFFSNVLAEGRQMIEISRDLIVSLNPDFSQLWPKTDSSLLTDASSVEMERFVFRLFSVPLGLACLLGIFSIAITRFVASKMKFQTHHTFSFLSMKIPGRFVFPTMMVLSLFLGQEQSALGFIMLPLAAGLSTMYIIHGFSTAHFILRNQPYRVFLLVLFYFLVMFVPFLGFLPLLLGLTEQLVQLKAKNVAI